MFQKIDRSVWKREEFFNHYFSAVPCTYSMTVQMDITHIRKAHQSLYPAMVYAISTIVNRHEEFRTALNSQGEAGIYDVLVPCYTVFHKESETFSNIWTEYISDYTAFCAAFNQDLQEYGESMAMDAKPNEPDNSFPISMIPWTVFQGFNLNLQKGYNYLLPIFTMGKFEEQGARCLLPLSIQVHHAVCDGFHVSRFIDELQALLHQL